MSLLHLPLPLLILLLLLLLSCHFLVSIAQDDTTLLNAINQYRNHTVGIPALSNNPGATCLAQQVLTQYENTACTNSTGLDTVPGQEPDYPNFPDWLNQCNIPLDRTKDGQILPDCVPGAPSNGATIAAMNYTQSHADALINDATYTSAGAASGKGWFVLILGTNSSTGDYMQTSGAASWPASLFLLCFILGALFAPSW